MLTKHHLVITNFEKEEAWIKTMNEKGYVLKKVWTSTGKYVFEESGSISRQVIKMDVRTFKRKSDFLDYVQLFEDSGWRHIGGTKNSGLQYFEKVEEQASDDIFSDHYSKAERYKRLATMWFETFIAFLPFVIILYNTSMSQYNLWNPKSLYLTPGLWELKGARFVYAFLFETPFAVMRGFGWLVLFVMIVSYLCFGMKSIYWYRKERQEG